MTLSQTPSCGPRPATWPETILLSGSHKVALVPALLVSEQCCKFILLTPDSQLLTHRWGYLGLSLPPSMALMKELPSAFLFFCTKLLLCAHGLLTLQPPLS